MQIPTVIYLQIHGEDRLFDDDPPLSAEDVSEWDVSWCSDRIYNTDEAYIRMTEYKKLVKALERNVRDFDAIRRLASQGHSNGKAQLSDVRSAARAAKRESELFLEKMKIGV